MPSLAASGAVGEDFSGIPGSACAFVKPVLGSFTAVRSAADEMTFQFRSATVGSEG